MKTEKYNVLVLKSNYLKAFQFLLFKLSQTKNKHQVSNRTFRIMFFFFPLVRLIGIVTKF